MKLVLNQDQQVAEYVDRLSLRRRKWSDFVAIGLADKNGDLCAGAVFCNMEKPNIQIHVGIEAAAPGFIAAIVHYAFVQLGCGRMTAFIRKSNSEAQRFAKKLGGRIEGVMRDAAPDGDVIVWGMNAAAAQRWLTPAYMRKLKGVLNG
jgi:RimJ/RimL family protein N-acetyltransferase